MTRPVRGILIALALTAAALAVPKPAQAQPCVNSITQSFGQTSWHVCWREVAGSNSLANPNGLVIGPADFKTTPGGPWRRIIYDMRISDFFVPYHPGSPRYYDLSGFNFTLLAIPPAACPAAAGATLLPGGHVCQEVHDRGLLYIDRTNLLAARGHELVLWGAINAANYKYVERYVFRDDGVIVGEEGATGQNLPGSELVTHVHNALWRIDMDLFTPSNNNVTHMQHIEPSGTPPVATDSMTPITVAGGVQWNARTHDSLMLANTAAKNARGHNPSYILMPFEMGGGLTQHAEPFTRNDFWVTRYNPTQMAASQLPAYVAGGTPVANTDVVLWFKSSLHHHPRDEDGNYINNGAGPWHGTALVMYAGFMLMPFDLFDCTPFYNPGACP